jgi:hypothetical protein
LRTHTADKVGIHRRQHALLEQTIGAALYARVS